MSWTGSLTVIQSTPLQWTGVSTASVQVFFSVHCNKWKGCQKNALVRQSPCAGCGVWESPFRQGGVQYSLPASSWQISVALLLLAERILVFQKVEGHRQYEKQLLFWCTAALRGFSSSPERRYLMTVCLYKDWIAWQISAICKKKIFSASPWLNRVCHLNARARSPPYFIPFRIELLLSLFVCFGFDLVLFCSTSKSTTLSLYLNFLFFFFFFPFNLKLQFLIQRYGHYSLCRLFWFDCIISTDDHKMARFTHFSVMRKQERKREGMQYDRNRIKVENTNTDYNSSQFISSIMRKYRMKIALIVFFCV